MAANANIHSTVKQASSLLISRHIAPDGTEIVWKGLNIVRNKPGVKAKDEKNKMNGLEIIWEDIQIIKRGKHVNPAAAANVQPISYYAPVLAYNKNTTPATGSNTAPNGQTTATGIPPPVNLKNLTESEISSSADLQLALLLNPQANEEQKDGSKGDKDSKEAGDKSQTTPSATEKKDTNNNQVIEKVGAVVTKVGTLTAVKPGDIPKVEKMDTSTALKTEIKQEPKDTADPTKTDSKGLPASTAAGKDSSTSDSKNASSADQKSSTQTTPDLSSTEIKEEKLDIDDKPMIGADGSISSDLATELKAWRVRAQNAEKRVQKVELQLVNMKRRAETAEVRAGIKPADDPEGDTLNAVEAMKATVAKNTDPAKQIETATKWATDAMVNQASAEKAAKAAEEKAAKAEKQASVAVNDAKLAEMRADNAERKNLEFEEEMAKMKKESDNMRNRALAAESRAEAMLAAMQKRAGRTVDSGSDREGPKPSSKLGSQLKDRRRSDDEKFEIIEIDSIKDKMKGKPGERGGLNKMEWDRTSSAEFIKGPGGRNINAKYKCSHCEFTSTRKTDYEKHVKRCVLEIAARSSIRKPNKPGAMDDTGLSKNRVRRQAAANALDTIVEGDQSWQGLMLDNKGIRPGVPVPLPGEESTAGFNDDDEETFLAAECQELFGDILDGDSKNSDSNADLQLAEEILNDWEKEDLMSKKPKSKSNTDKDSGDKSSTKTTTEKKRSSDDLDEDSNKGKKEKFDTDAPLSNLKKDKKITKEDDFGPAIPLF